MNFAHIAEYYRFRYEYCEKRKYKSEAYNFYRLWWLYDQI